MNKIKTEGYNLFVVESLPGEEGGWLSRTILHYCIHLIKVRIQTACIKASSALVTSNKALIEWQPRDVGITEVRIPDQLAYKYKNHANFSLLHQFVDAVIKESEGRGHGDLFVHKGVPLLKVVEPRWIDPLFNQILWRLDFCADYISSRPRPDRVAVFAGRQIAPSIKKFFALAGVRRAAGDPVIDFLLWLHSGISSLSLSLQVHGMSKRNAWMGQSKHANFSNWGQETGLRRILFIGTIDRTVARLREIAPLLITKGYEVYLVANARITLAAELRSLGVKVAFLGDFYPKINNKPLSGKKRKSSRSAVKDIVNATQGRQFKYQGIELGALASEYLYDAICRFRNAAIDSVDIADHVLDLIQPHLVVTFEENEFPRAITFLAKVRSIPSATLLLLSPAWYPGLLRREQNEIWVSGDVLKRLFCPWSDGRKVTVIGDPLVDRARDRRVAFDKDEFCVTHDIPLGGGLFGVLSTWPDYSSVTLEDIKTLLCTASMYAVALGKVLIVKCHPMQEADQVKRWMRHWRCDGVVISNCDLIDFSMACDVVFVPSTTAIWQVMLAGTPIVSFQHPPTDLDSGPFGMGYGTERGVVQLSAESPQFDLVSALASPDSTLRAEQIMRGFKHVSEHVGPLDGNAVKRFVAEIETCFLRRSKEGDMESCIRPQLINMSKQGLQGKAFLNLK
jgi:hypothetical protein